MYKAQRMQFYSIKMIHCYSIAHLQSFYGSLFEINLNLNAGYSDKHSDRQ